MSYFGTDGVRGKAGVFPLIPETLTQLGRAIGKKSKGPVVIGRDTRESGEWFLHALSAGIMSEGSDVWDLGICPTPTVARITAKNNKGLGLVISASHNLAADNGIKVLQSNGRKATKAMENYFEKSLVNNSVAQSVKHASHFLNRHDLVDGYLEDVLKLFKKLDLRGLHIAVDTAHGAATDLAPQVLLECGATIVQVGGSPNGKNINYRCGSMHMSALKNKIKQHNCDIGFAFDGDADRCLGITSEGVVLDGDSLLAILSHKYTKKKKTLVGTVMTNQGLEDFLNTKKIKLHRTSVGDKYVVEKMRRIGSALGGENSGHIIVAKHGFVGDGILTMLAVLDVLSVYNFDTEKALGDYCKYPQVLINILVKKKKPFESNPAIKKAIMKTEDQLKGQGRLLLRYSGTENLARVMVEAKSQHLARTSASELATIIKKHLGKK